MCLVATEVKIRDVSPGLASLESLLGIGLGMCGGNGGGSNGLAGNKIEYYNDVWTREGSSHSTDATSSSEGLEFKSLPAGIHTMDEDCL